MNSEYGWGTPGGKTTHQHIRKRADEVAVRILEDQDRFAAPDEFANGELWGLCTAIAIFQFQTRWVDDPDEATEHAWNIEFKRARRIRLGKKNRA